MNDFQTVVKKLNEDTELRDRVMGASSNDERKQIMESAGLPLPSMEEVSNAQSLANVDGGANTATYISGTVEIAGAFA